MKKYIIILVSLLSLSFVFVVHTAVAEERYKVYEMGETGQTVSFLMSADEIAAEDAESARQAAIRKANLQKATSRFKVFEMGEGGHTVALPMTAEEVATADAEQRRRA